MSPVEREPPEVPLTPRGDPTPGADMFHCPLYDPTAAQGITNTITSYTMDGAACGFGALLTTNPAVMQSYKITQIQARGGKGPALGGR